MLTGISSWLWRIPGLFGVKHGNQAQADLVTVRLSAGASLRDAQANQRIVEVVNASAQAVGDVTITLFTRQDGIVPVGLRPEDVGLRVTPGLLSVDIVEPGTTVNAGIAAVRIRRAEDDLRADDGEVTLTWLPKPEPFIPTNDALNRASDLLGTYKAQIKSSLLPADEQERKKYEWFVERAHEASRELPYQVTDVIMQFTDKAGRRWQRTGDGTLSAVLIS